ncbi:MAG TPA: hypothetical protein VJI97_02495 [Candidatus Nanoarchaeia archaeon]|nr:hypothetical protein [Candidatus Nanoarchaeia archaeon]
MIDLRRVAIIFVIGILYAVLVNAIIDAVYPSPKYEDFCKGKYYPDRSYPIPAGGNCQILNPAEQDKANSCFNDKGNPEYNYDSKGCETTFKECNYCQKDFEAANQKYNLYTFIISSILAVIAIMVALMLPSDNGLNEWIATGFMLGGLFSLFYGTIRYYTYLGRWIRPVVILIELMLVIYLAYKKLTDNKGSKKKKR